MRITTIMNQKGGVGKTTTAHALASGLTMKGYKVLVIDSDLQCNLTDTYNADAQGIGLYEVLRGQATVADAITHTEQGDILTASESLCDIDVQLADAPGRLSILRNALSDLNGQYDHIIIDAPPALNTIALNNLVASTDVIIPLNASIYSMNALRQLLDTIEQVQTLNTVLCVAGLLVCRKNGRSTVVRDTIDFIMQDAEQKGLHAYSSIIREAAAILEAQIVKQSIYEYAPKAAVTADYRAFVDEYLKQEA